MPLVELEWDWVYVTIISIVAIFVIAMTSDMIANWKDKKISDVRALILGTGIFGIILLLLTVDFKITVLIGLILANTILASLMAADNRFTTSDKPWELYVMLLFSLAILIFSIGWVYYNTGLGEAIQAKFNKDKLYEDENGNMVYVDSKNNEVTVVDKNDNAVTMDIKTYRLKDAQQGENTFYMLTDDELRDAKVDAAIDRVLKEDSDNFVDINDKETITSFNDLL